MNKIGYYIHHHGDGHRQRALAIAQQSPECFTLIGTGLAGRTENISYIDLPDDQTSHQNYKRYHLKATHYTPIHHQGIKERMAIIAQWIAQTQPSLLVVDVSVEIAMLARLCSTPTVYVRLLGNRFDEAHLDAFRAAEAILCPFHQLLEHKKTPKWLIEKSYYFSGLTVQDAHSEAIPNYIVIALGAGGHDIKIEQLIDMAQQLPDWRIDVLGPLTTSVSLPSNLNILGWVNNIAQYIAKASIIVGAAGDGLVAQVTATGKPYICLPQHRPFFEQEVKAKQLKKLDAAVVCKSWPDHWPKIIKQALKHGSVMKFLHDENSLAKANEFLLTLAHGQKLPFRNLTPPLAQTGHYAGKRSYS